MSKKKQKTWKDYREGKTLVTIYFPDKLKKKFHAYCLENDTNMSDVMLAYAEKLVTKKKKKKKNDA